MSDTAVLEAHYIVRAAAEPWSAGDSVKSGIGRAARTLGIGYRRARTFWYCQPCAVLATEMDRLRSKHLEMLVKRHHRLQAECEIIAAKLAGFGSGLENMHGADDVARMARASVGDSVSMGAPPGRGVPATARGAAQPALNRSS